MSALPIDIPNPLFVPGQPLPDFAGEAWDGTRYRFLDSREHRGSWLVLLIYPRDFDAEARLWLAGFAEAQAEFERRGVALVAASRDSAHSHQAWLATTPELSHVRFPILGDACERFACDGAPFDFPSRGLVLADPNGVVRQVDLDDPKMLEPAMVLREIEALRAPVALEPRA